MSHTYASNTASPGQIPPPPMTLMEVSRELSLVNNKIQELSIFAEAMLCTFRGSRPEQAQNEKNEPSTLRANLTAEVHRLHDRLHGLRCQLEEFDSIFGTGYAQAANCTSNAKMAGQGVSACGGLVRG